MKVIVDSKDIKDFDQLNTDTEYKHTFSFDCLSYNSVEEPKLVADEALSSIFSSKQDNKYVFVKTLEYFTNYYTNIFKNLLPEKNPFFYTKIALDYISVIKNIKIQSFLPRRLFLYNIEKSFNDIPLIKNILDTTPVSQNLKIDLSVFCNDKECLLHTKQVIDEYIKFYSDYIKKTKIIMPKGFVKFKELLKLLNCRNEKVFKYIEHCIIKAFDENNEFLTKSTYSLDEISKHLNIKVRKEDLAKYVNFILSDSSSDNYHVPYEIVMLCFKNKDKPIKESLFIKPKETDLTEKDFAYVSSYNYIKQLLDSAIKQNKKGINILLYGSPGTGKTALASVLLKSLNVEGYAVETNNFDSMNAMSLFFNKDEGVMRNNNNSSVLGNRYRIKNFLLLSKMLQYNKKAVIIYDEAEDFFRRDSDTTQSKATINELLENNKVPVIWTTNSLYCLEQSYLRRFTYILRLDQLPLNTYESILEKLFNKYNVQLNNNIRQKYLENRPSIGIIEKVLKNYIMSKSTDQNVLEEDMLNSIIAENYGYLNTPNKVYRPGNFDPRLLNTSNDLESLIKRLKENNRRDFSLLLYGVSGSGKSYYAEYLGQELKMQVIKKKASDLESCYVGETEQNISRAFYEAKQQKAILVIDEGDHFIAERKHDNRSWENSRTEEMLQQIEEHPYPVIFTTNLIQNIDKAAMRRFTYKTEFKYLTDEQVKIAWQDYFPNAALPKEIHLSKLCPGDFATVLKRAQFEGYTTSTEEIYNNLQEEMNMKKEDNITSIMF